MNKEEIRQLRQTMKNYRLSLTAAQVKDYSDCIIHQLINLPQFQSYHTIMLYRCIDNEVNLDYLPQLCRNKTFCYPACISKTEMQAYIPQKWVTSNYGIPEPDTDTSILVNPWDIDLVICPGVAFDIHGNRLGHGAGYYDRYLPLCTNATVILVAYEQQKAESMPSNPWDYPMDLIITESNTYITPKKR